MLLIATERYHMCILAFENGEIVTRAAGDIQDRIGKPTENGQIGIIDPQFRTTALHLYEGLLKVVPFDQDQKKVREAFNVRLEELNVIDIQFLHESNWSLAGTFSAAGLTTSNISGGASSSSSSNVGGSTGTYSISDHPAIAVLHEDSKGARHIKTYYINMKEKDFIDGPFQQPNVESGATHLISVPFGGVVIVGEHTIAYHDGSQCKSFNLERPTSIRAYGKIDISGERWLLGDQSGALYLLHLMTDSQRRIVTDLKLECLGETSIASCICYLDDGYVFIGSTYGDSQLIKLNSEVKDENASFVEVVGNYTNLGPIIDFTVVDLDNQGQGQVITCSGGLKDGTVRIVRNGIGIDEQASIEMEGIKGIWSVRSAVNLNEQQLIILTFVGETRAMGIDEEGDLGEIDVPGLATQQQTLLVQTFISGSNRAWIQVTASEIRLLDLTTHSLISSWKPLQSGDWIHHVSANDVGQIVVSFGGGRMAYLSVDQSDHSITLVSSITLPNEVSCIDLSILGGQKHAEWVACGMWRENSIRLLRLPQMDQSKVHPLETSVLPRSVSLSTFEDIDYLLCALGDGHLLTYKFDRTEGSLSDRKVISLGNKPTLLTPFSSVQESTSDDDPAGHSTIAVADKHIFAASDRPTVIYGSNRKILFSNVNLKEVNFVCQFNCDQFPGGLAIAKENELMIGIIDEIQKLHIRTIPLGEQPKRIAYHSASESFAVCTIRSIINATTGEENESNFIRLLSARSFEFVDEYKLDAYEHTASIAAIKLYNAPSASEDSSNMATASNIIGGTAAADHDHEEEDQHNKIAADSIEFVIVGTAYVPSDEDEPTRGRILVFEIKTADDDGASSPKLTLVAEKEVKGAVYCMSAFNGKLLAGVNSRVHLFKWNEQIEGGFELVPECSHSGHIIALTLQARGNFIIVGDLMRSISLLHYNSIDGSLEEIARDYNTNWITATEILDDETYIGAENGYNIFTLRRNVDATSDEERRKLQVCGLFHLGDMVNKFAHGSLVMRSPETSLAATIGTSADKLSKTDSGKEHSNIAKQDDEHGGAFIVVPKIDVNFPSLLYGTVNGSLGVIASIPEKTFRFFDILQKAMNHVVKGVGNLSHNVWRSFSNERTRNEMLNFIDGDLVESFLDLSESQKRSVLAHFKNLVGDKQINIGVDDVTKAIEEIQTQLH